MPKARTRLAVAVVSAAVIGLELALMRSFSFRFWHHFASMIISVALVGFGASGTALVFLRRRVAGRERDWLSGAAVLFAVSVPAAAAAAGAVPVNVQFLAWDLSEILNVAAVELLLVIPFFLAGCCIAVALTDEPARLSGHYAANLVGSGAGAILVVLAMWRLDTAGLLRATSALGLAGGVLVLPWRRSKAAGLAAGCAVVWAILALALPLNPRASQYKAISLVANMPGTEFLYHAEGPPGTVDAVAGPAIHYAPGVGLRYDGKVPEPTLILSDGEVLCAIYDERSRLGWRFAEHTTEALSLDLRPNRPFLMIGVGGAGIGCALYHGTSDGIIVAEPNPLVVQALAGPLFARGGWNYQRLFNADARGLFSSPRPRWHDLRGILLSVPGGASGGGVQAAQESYLYTVEAFVAMLEGLRDSGILSLTCSADSPPRRALRVFDTAAEALRRRGFDPAERLAMIRSWATVTVLASRTPFSARDLRRIREFCDERGFDLCYLPGLDASEVNRFHILERPSYWEGARELLGPHRDEFLRQYPFEIRAASDDRPYFFHFFTLKSLAFLGEQIGGRSRAFFEVGYLLILAALAQAIIMAAVFIVLPLAARVKGFLAAEGKLAASVYFGLLGAGFMLLEICFLQRLILYLAHPVYSSAAVISGFLVFAGLGSLASGVWRVSPARVAAAAAEAVVAVSVIYILALDGWLSLTQSWSQAARFAVGCATIAPLAFAMGHMFPLGLKRVSSSSAALVPWAWALNGFASVAATAAAPVVAINFGFSRLTLAAVVCYVLAGAAFLLLPGRTAREREGA